MSTLSEADRTRIRNKVLEDFKQAVRVEQREGTQRSEERPATPRKKSGRLIMNMDELDALEFHNICGSSSQQKRSSYFL